MRARPGCGDRNRWRGRRRVPPLPGEEARRQVTAAAEAGRPRRPPNDVFSKWDSGHHVGGLRTRRGGRAADNVLFKQKKAGVASSPILFLLENAPLGSPHSTHHFARRPGPRKAFCRPLCHPSNSDFTEIVSPGDLITAAFAGRAPNRQNPRLRRRSQLSRVQASPRQHTVLSWSWGGWSVRPSIHLSLFPSICPSIHPFTHPIIYSLKTIHRGRVRCRAG